MSRIFNTHPTISESRYLSRRFDSISLSSRLGVQAGLRGRGIGSSLLEAVDRRAMELDKTEVILEVVDTNPRARALYERFGYRTVLTTRQWMFCLAGFSAAIQMIIPRGSTSRCVDLIQ